MGDGTSGTNERQERPDGQVAQLDQAVWRRLRAGTSRAAFLDAWLTLQCRTVGGVLCGTVVVREGEENRFVPAAVWPPDAKLDPGLASATELAMGERRGVLRPAEDGKGDTHVALPFVVEERLIGAVALRVRARSDQQMRVAMRQLQWGAGWIELMVRRESQADSERGRERAVAALDVIAVLLESEKFNDAATAAATMLAHRLDCDRVAIGILRGRRCKVVALSHSADVGERMQLVSGIGAAMEEALDQGATIHRAADRSEDDEPWVTREHGNLIRQHGALSVLTVPLVHGERVVGAITLEHRDTSGFGSERRELAQAIAAVIGPILDEKHTNSRLIVTKLGHSILRQFARVLGPAYLGRKLALIVLAGLVAFFWFVEEDYEVAADATLEGRVQRVVAAPFDGYLNEQSVRPGDVVAAGQVLARFDDRDLQLERVRSLAEKQQREIEYAAALASGERTEVRVLQAQIAQIDARIGLLEEQIARTSVLAPFDGVVVSGDHSQDVGAAIQRGQELFVVAPLDGYRVVLMVDERDISEIVPGQQGAVRFASMPDTPLGLAVDQILPVAHAAEGVNRFRVEAALDGTARDEAGQPLLPGMEGVGRIEVGQRRLIWIWTHSAVEWLRLAVWRWLP